MRARQRQAQKLPGSLTQKWQFDAVLAQHCSHQRSATVGSMTATADSVTLTIPSDLILKVGEQGQICNLGERFLCGLQGHLLLRQIADGLVVIHILQL